MCFSLRIGQHNLVRVTETSSLDPDSFTTSGKVRLEICKDWCRGPRFDLNHEGRTAIAVDFHNYLTRPQLKLFRYDYIEFLNALLQVCFLATTSVRGGFIFGGTLDKQHANPLVQICSQTIAL